MFDMALFMRVDIKVRCEIIDRRPKFKDGYVLWSVVV